MNQDKLVEVSGNDYSPQNSNTLSGMEVPATLQNIESESVQRRWLKKLVWTINQVFSPEERFDDELFMYDEYEEMELMDEDVQEEFIRYFTD